VFRFARRHQVAPARGVYSVRVSRTFLEKGEFACERAILVWQTAHTMKLRIGIPMHGVLFLTGEPSSPQSRNAHSP